MQEKDTSLHEAQPLSPSITAPFYPRLFVREFSYKAQIFCPTLWAAPGSPASPVPPRTPRQPPGGGARAPALRRQPQISPGKVRLWRRLSHPARAEVKTPTSAPWGCSESSFFFFFLWPKAAQIPYLCFSGTGSKCVKAV